MPQIRAEQIANKTVMDLQIAVNAAIKQSKIEHWQSDPTGWLSKGIVKVVDVEPNWEDGLHLEREGQLFYLETADELHLAISQPPYHIVLSGSTIQHNWDSELTVKSGSESEDFENQTGTEFKTLEHEFTIDGSDLYVYLNGSIQRLGLDYDYIILDDRTIKFTHQIEEDDTVTMIVVFSPLVAAYATKAWTIHRYEQDTETTGSERVRVRPVGNLLSDNVQAALEEIQINIDDIVSGDFDIHYSLDDAYRDGSVVQVDTTNVEWIMDPEHEFKITAGVKKLFEVKSAPSASPSDDLITINSDVILGGSITPSTTEAYDLGTSSAKFRNIHAQELFLDETTIHLGSNSRIRFNSSLNRLQFTNNDSDFLNALGTAAGIDVVLESNLRPNAQNTLDFGTQNQAWKDMYIGSSINFVPTGDPGDVSRIYRNVSGSSTEMRFQIGSSSNDKIIFEDEGQVAILTLDGDRHVEIHGDLTVTGNTTTVTSTTTQVSDTSFVIAHSTPSASTDASYEVERTTINSKLYWNESIDMWQVDNGDNVKRDILFDGYDNYIFTNKATNSLGIGIAPTSNLDVATAGDTTAAIRTTASNNQTSTFSIKGARTNSGSDITVINLEDNSGSYQPLAKIITRKQTNETQQGNLLLQTNVGSGSYSTITIDKDAGITLNGNGKLTPNSSTALGGSTPLSYNGHFYAEKVYNAVWNNDIADFFEVENELDVIEYGKAYVLDEYGNAKISESYMEEGIIGIASDTYGYGLGKRGVKNEIPIGVAGIVLAYVDKDYRTGTPLTVGPNGILTEFLQIDKVKYPERMIATFYRREKREKLVSGENETFVKGRCWVKVK